MISKLNLTLYWLIGCALAVLFLQLAGCGEVTEAYTPLSRSEVSSEQASDGGKAEEAYPTDTAPDSDENDGSGDRTDGEGPARDSDNALPVCPPHFYCGEGPLNNCLCAVCTGDLLPTCKLQGKCRCPDVSERN